MNVWKNLHDGISPERTEMSILSCKVEMCYGSGVCIRAKERGGISPERPKLTLRDTNFYLFL